MRMSVLFALTCLFSAFNLVFMPFHPVMMLWAFGLSAAFVIVNIIADRLDWPHESPDSWYHLN